ncbi:cytochrome C oxidase Cbb3 [Blattabacterium cuenoti]|uniref:cytochrome C oxidase Cbb3 n=1 Tax=Blattabacterium cuenoti TaxID=1653831 RepID=UPI00163D01C3|nr:cytochrome C oxidase Cbb3 [Blattabacterium cuenoti]
MKIKFNWGIGISLSIICFMIFILYMAFFFPNVESQLISNKYYEDEIKYQEIINEKNNVLNFPEKVKVMILYNGIEIRFPYDYENTVQGFVKLLRFSSKDLDITKHFCIIKYCEKKIFIPKHQLKRGYYKLIIRWKSNNKFFFEKNLFWE